MPAGPEETMRSRYSAFCLGNLEYLKKTWHPETLPDDLDDSEPMGWVHLDVVEVAIDDEEGLEGEVEFVAKLIHNKKVETLHEVSQFEKVDGKWLYHSGEFKSPENNVEKLKGSDPCPCKSGKQFKNCHA
jgi:SEC-C motif-containing protein